MKAKNKTQFEHLQNKRKTQREREAERDQKRYDEQKFPFIGKINLF